jgi:hypothetical protein
VALAGIGDRERNLISRGGAKDVEALEEKIQFHAKLVVPVARELCEELLFQVDIGLQTVGLLHREAESTLIDHAVRLLP